MVDKSLKNPGLDRFRRSVAARELELAVSYPRAVSSADDRRSDRGKNSTPAPLIVWPSPAVMPGAKELHDFANQRRAPPHKDSAPPAHPLTNVTSAQTPELPRKLLPKK